MTTPLRRSIYLTACIALGGFAAALIVAAVGIWAGVDYTIRAPLGVAASVVGMLASGALVLRHWAHEGDER